MSVCCPLHAEETLSPVSNASVNTGNREGLMLGNSVWSEFPPDTRAVVSSNLTQATIFCTVAKSDTVCGTSL
jgi:hypothetical protein